MQRLTKSDLERKAALLAGMGEAQGELDEAVIAFNEQVQALYAQIVTPGIEKFNARLEEAEEFRQEIASRQAEYVERRSDKWQESDAGNAYDLWMDEWRNEFEQIEMRQPEVVEVPENDTLDRLDRMPDECEEA